MRIEYRKIRKEDNEAICNIIRTVLEEYDGKKQGTAYYDYDTEHIYEAYQGEGEVYFVAVADEKLVGGAGIKLLAGNSGDIAELQKLYLLPEYRGYGIGKKLMELTINFAKETGYKSVYLETFENMKEARNLYKKFGFEYLESPLGDTGHSSCPVWMLLDLAQ